MLFLLHSCNIIKTISWIKNFSQQIHYIMRNWMILMMKLMILQCSRSFDSYNTKFFKKYLSIRNSFKTNSSSIHQNRTPTRDPVKTGPRKRIFRKNQTQNIQHLLNQKRDSIFRGLTFHDKYTITIVTILMQIQTVWSNNKKNRIQLHAHEIQSFSNFPSSSSNFFY